MAKALSSNPPRDEARAAVRRIDIKLTVISLTALAMLGLWSVALRAPAVTYGEPSATHCSQPTAAPGEEIGLCFDSVTWNRLCPAELVTSLNPWPGSRVSRIDLPTHRISTPIAVGPVAAKCRPFTVPKTITPGPWTLEGYARAECAPLGSWAPVITPLPNVKLLVVKPAG